MREYENGRWIRQRILEGIAVFWETNGYSPSIKELAKSLHICRSNCYDHLRVLRDQGFIAFEPHLSRDASERLHQAYGLILRAAEGADDQAQPEETRKEEKHVWPAPSVPSV